MTKAEIIAKMKAAGLTEAEIETITGGDTSSEVAALKAKIAEAEGKASGILGDKKKYQQRVEELTAKLEELEGKDLTEAARLKLDTERMKSRLEAAEKSRADLESTYKTEKRTAELNRIAQKLKFLESVPDDARQLLISNELKDIEDLGDQIKVDDRLKSVSQKYSGLLAANVASGGGTKSNQQINQPGNRPNLDAVLNKSLAEIAKDPKAYVAAALAASGD